MELIRYFDTHSKTPFKKISGCIPTDSLFKLEITDDRIGPLPAHGVLSVPDLKLSVSQTERWQHQHLFLRSILIRNEHLDYGIYIHGHNRLRAYKDGVTGETGDPYEDVPLDAWWNDLWNANFYIGRDYTPYTFGKVSVPHYEATNAKHYDHKYEVYSPFLRNGKYNGGEMYFHNSARDINKALKIVQQRVRPPQPEEQHLVDFDNVLEQQSRAVNHRGRVAREYATEVANYRNRDDVLEELVAMRMYGIRSAAKEPCLSSFTPYEFQNEHLAKTIDSYIEETKAVGEAIDPELESSRCIQRVHIITGGSSGRKYFSRTVILREDDSPSAFQKVFGDTVNAAYRPIESMPEDIAANIATLDLLNKEGLITHEPNWMLNIGVMAKKGELYYLPTKASEIDEEGT